MTEIASNFNINREIRIECQTEFGTVSIKGHCSDLLYTISYEDLIGFDEVPLNSGIKSTTIVIKIIGATKVEMKEGKGI